MRIPWNYHTHTTFCDGKNTAEEMVQAALRENMEILGFSGHMDQDIHMELPVYRQEIQGLRQKYADRLEILMGIELDALYAPACCEGMDYWIGSTHFLREGGKAVDWSPEATCENCETLFGGDYYAMCRAYYALEATVYTRTHCTFVGHFDLITRFNDQMQAFDETDKRYLDPAISAMEVLCRQDIPFEVNCGAHNRGRKKELYPRTELLKALHDLGGRIVFSSDAHDDAHLTGSFPEAVQRALACGFRECWYLKRGSDGKVAWQHRALDEGQRI